MKRPEETTYPTPKNQLEESKKNIESAIDKNKFELSYDKIKKSPELEEWLAGYGWRLFLDNGDFRDHDPSIWKLIPIK